MTQHRVVMKSLGLCPCGQEVAASKKPAAVEHTQPTCKAFEDMEPDEFLAYVRKSREGQNQ